MSPELTEDKPLSALWQLPFQEEGARTTVWNWWAADS